MDKKQILLQLIKEELINKKAQDRSRKQEAPQTNININPGLAQILISNGLPIYEDDLKNILFEQSKDHIKKAICQVEYDQKIKENFQGKKNQRAETNGKIQSSFSDSQKQQRSRQTSNLYQTSQMQPDQAQVYQELQQNIITLFHNFTQMVAVNVAKNISANLNVPHQPTQHKRIKVKRVLTQDLQTQQNLFKKDAGNEIKQNLEETIPKQEQQFQDKSQLVKTQEPENQMNKVINSLKDDLKVTRKDGNIDEKSRPLTPSFNLDSKHQLKPSQLARQNIPEQQNVSQDLDEIYEEDFLEESQATQQNQTMHQNKSKATQSQSGQSHSLVPKQVQNKSKLSEDLDYPEDFVEESSAFNFSQQQSNFFPKKKENNTKITQSNQFGQSDRLDFSDDFEVEDLLQ